MQIKDIDEDCQHPKYKYPLEWVATVDKTYAKYILQGISNSLKLVLTEDSTLAQLVVNST